MIQKFGLLSTPGIQTHRERHGLRQVEPTEDLGSVHTSPYWCQGYRGWGRRVGCTLHRCWYECEATSCGSRHKERAGQSHQVPLGATWADRVPHTRVRLHVRVRWVQRIGARRRLILRWTAINLGVRRCQWAEHVVKRAGGTVPRHADTQTRQPTQYSQVTAHGPP